MGLTLVQLFAVKEQIPIDSPPSQSSVALALNIIQTTLRHWSLAVHDPRDLRERLQKATKDTYIRHGSKRARYRPQNKDKPTATKPIIIIAIKQQRQAYQNLNIAT